MDEARACAQAILNRVQILYQGLISDHVQNDLPMDVQAVVAGMVANGTQAGEEKFSLFRIWLRVKYLVRRGLPDVVLLPGSPCVLGVHRFGFCRLPVHCLHELCHGHHRYVVRQCLSGLGVGVGSVGSTTMAGDQSKPVTLVASPSSW